MATIQRLFAKYDLPLMMLALVAVALAGCDMQSPSQISNSPIRITSEDYHETLPVASFDDEMATAIGKHFKTQGQGPVDVLVVYDPKSNDKKATNEARRVAALLEKHGVGPVVTSTLPVNEAPTGYQLMLSYKQLKALPPADCGQHPADNRSSITGNQNGVYESYRYGCGIDTYVAQQVVRPRDLLGSDRIGPSDGSRYGNILKDYRDGKPTKDLKAQTASEKKL
jgi:pilus biogenesis lipoprotein CpaD